MRQASATTAEILRVLPGLLGGAGIAVSVLVLSAVSRPHGAVVPLALLFIPLLALVVVVHEAGHALAAAGAGSWVVGASVGPLYIQRRRRGVRLRWLPRRRGAAGMTYAVPNFAKDVRRQVLFFTAGGPLANLLVAAVCLSVAWPAHHRMLTALSASIFVFGLLNATTGLANLVPIRRHYASDGWLLRRWWEGGEDVAAMRRALQVYEQSLRGVLASEIPTRQVEALQADAELGTRMLGHYVALRAAQERGDKRAFATIFELGARELADADKQTYEALRPLWTLFLIEQAFENACAGDQLRPDIDPAVLRMLPSHFTHRLRAAQAWASDDELTWRDALTKAERDAEGSFDHATRRAEAALLQRIRVPRANPAMIS